MNQSNRIFSNCFSCCYHSGIECMEESAIHPLPHAWAHRCPQLASVTEIDREECTGNYALLDFGTLTAAALSGFKSKTRWTLFGRPKGKWTLIIAGWGFYDCNNIKNAWFVGYALRTCNGLQTPCWEPWWWITYDSEYLSFFLSFFHFIIIEC